jgi:hemerythrin-like domain-containing protein
MEAQMTTVTATRDKHGRFTGSKASKSGGGGRSIGMIAGAAAGGAALGFLALLGRKAAVQAPSALAGNWDEALALEHEAVRKLFDLLEATDAHAVTRRNFHLIQLKHMLAKHAVEEENVIYPALREAGQKEAADELNKEHGYVKQYLYELSNMPAASPDWIVKLRRFRSDIEDHMREEEDSLFPMLRAMLSDEKNGELTLTMNKEGFKVA